MVKYIQLLLIKFIQQSQKIDELKFYLSNTQNRKFKKLNDILLASGTIPVVEPSPHHRKVESLSPAGGCIFSCVQPFYERAVSNLDP